MASQARRRSAPASRRRSPPASRRCSSRPPPPPSRGRRPGQRLAALGEQTDHNSAAGERLRAPPPTTATPTRPPPGRPRRQPASSCAVPCRTRRAGKPASRRAESSRIVSAGRGMGIPPHPRHPTWTGPGFRQSSARPLEGAAPRPLVAGRANLEPPARRRGSPAQIAAGASSPAIAGADPSWPGRSSQHRADPSRRPRLRGVPGLPAGLPGWTHRSRRRTWTRSLAPACASRVTPTPHRCARPPG